MEGCPQDGTKPLLYIYLQSYTSGVVTILVTYSSDLEAISRYSHLTEAHTAGVVALMNEAIFPNGNVG